jgi:hypothetical protein
MISESVQSETHEEDAEEGILNMLNLLADPTFNKEEAKHIARKAIE